jgi:phosphoribosylanthranilate isomerase
MPTQPLIGADALFCSIHRAHAGVTPGKWHGSFKPYPLVTTVGLFVDVTCDVVNEIVACCGLTVQLHGVRRGILSSDGRPVIKTMRIRMQRKLSPVPDYVVSAYLWMHTLKGAAGGTGASFAWELAARKPYGPIILAGG